MNTEFFEALTLLEKEKGISADYLLEKIQNAIVIAVKRDYVGVENVVVDVDQEKGNFDVYIVKEVKDEVLDPVNEILPQEALKYDKKAQVGDMVRIQLETKQFGRIAAQTAKHVIRQGIREAERGQLLKDFQSREHEIVTAQVLKLDRRKGTATLEIDRTEATSPNLSRFPPTSSTREIGSRSMWWR